MFSVREKREIAEAIQIKLRETNHPELPGPEEEIAFELYVWGSTGMAFACIRNNGRVPNPSVNPHNEAQDTFGKGEVDGIIPQA